MTDYFQPEFYRFNEDSLRLVKWVLNKTTEANHILDLGAGCGIIGIELARVLKPENLNLVELQTDFVPYIHKNCSLFLQSTITVRISETSFQDWKPAHKFDLIVSNPPYFLPGHGEQSQDERKGLARSFIRDNWRILMEKIDESLSDHGKAFLVIRKDNRIVKEIEKTGQKFKILLSEQGHLYFVELSRLNKD